MPKPPSLAAGLVVDEGGVAEGHGRPGPSLSMAPPLPATPAPPPARLPVKTELVMVAVEGVASVQPGVVLDGAADAEVTRAGPERLVVDERAVGHRQRGAAEVVDAAADAAAEEGAAAAAQGLVAAEGGGDDGGRALVEQAAAEDIDRVGGGRRRVVVQGTCDEGQGGPGLVEDAASAEAADGRCRWRSSGRRWSPSRCC